MRLADFEITVSADFICCFHDKFCSSYWNIPKWKNLFTVHNTILLFLFARAFNFSPDRADFLFLICLPKNKWKEKKYWGRKLLLFYLWHFSWFECIFLSHQEYASQLGWKKSWVYFVQFNCWTSEHAWNNHVIWPHDQKKT